MRSQVEREGHEIIIESCIVIIEQLEQEKKNLRKILNGMVNIKMVVTSMILTRLMKSHLTLVDEKLMSMGYAPVFDIYSLE